MKEIKRSFIDRSDRIRFPEWYDFYNIRRGTDSLMLLPDVRGEKEEFYLSLVRENRKREDGEQPESAMNKTQYIYAFGEDLDNFVTRFENSQVQKLYGAYQFANGKRQKKEDIDYELDVLMEAEERVPIEANADWKTALVNAARRYERRKTVEALPQAWEQYRINVDLGISFRMSRYDKKGWLKDMMKEMIIKGRIINGEPADLDF